MTTKLSRAAQARVNGARSKGPRTAAGKARSAMNALAHGLSAAHFVVLPEEDPAAFEALLAIWVEALAPASALERELVRKIAAADWRLQRADRIECELFAEGRMVGDDGRNPLALAMLRDNNGARGFATLIRYRAAASCELVRLRRLLEALRARPEAPEAASTESAKRTRKPRAASPEPPIRAPYGTRTPPPVAPSPLWHAIDAALDRAGPDALRDLPLARRR